MTLLVSGLALLGVFLVIYLIFRRVVRKTFWFIGALLVFYLFFHVFVRSSYYSGDVPEFLDDFLAVVEFPFRLGYQVMGESFRFFDEVLRDITRRY